MLREGVYLGDLQLVNGVIRFLGAAIIPNIESMGVRGRPGSRDSRIEIPNEPRGRRIPYG